LASIYKQSRPDNQHSSLLSEVLQFFCFLLLGGAVATAIAAAVAAAVAAAMATTLATAVTASLTASLANAMANAMANTLTTAMGCCCMSMFGV